MSRAHDYLAFDLGAESGRALVGHYQGGRLSVEELHRFPNDPVNYNGELHWDAARLWHEMEKALALAAQRAAPLEGIGVDTWGLDYALLGEGGTLLENPYHYRDTQTDGMMERVFKLVPPDEIYALTGIQFMQVNGLYRLFTEQVRTPRLLAAAEKLFTIPDLFNFWLTGVAAAEFTNATTTQFYDPRKGDWSAELLSRLSIPTHFLTPIIQPGTVLGGLRAGVARKAGLASSVQVIAPACHDTGSAVAAIARAGESVFISSGTWSLLGTEISKPIINSEAQQLNFTNEGGVCGTFRLLKNIMGLWLLQRCRHDWERAGQRYEYDELAAMALASPPFQSLVDPDDSLFLHPEDMPQAIQKFCAASGQTVPKTPAAMARAVLESLAFKYRYVLDRLEHLTGRSYPEIHIVGGGAQNRVLNQFTAEATGRRVVAGPIEATALGNIGMQMLATRAAGSLEEVRDIISKSFPAETFEPREHGAWGKTYERFQQYCTAAMIQSQG